MPKESDSFARAYIDTVRTGSLDGAAAALAPSLAQVPGIRDSLAHVRTFFAPGAVDSIQVVGVQLFSTRDVTRADLVYQLHSAGGWTAVRVVVAEEMGHRFIEGFRVEPEPDSFARMNRFTFAGKGAGHVLFFLVAAGIALFTLWAAFQVARTRALRRRWWWAFVALLGVTQVTLNWTTGRVFTQLFNVQLFGAAIMQAGPASPWIVAFSFPIGAIVALRRRRRALDASAASLAATPAAPDTPPVGEAPSVTVAATPAAAPEISS